MDAIEIAKVQNYLRTTFGSQRIRVIAPKKANAPVEVMVGEEFIGVLHKDVDEGETSYAFHMTILDIDLED